MVKPPSCDDMKQRQKSEHEHRIDLTAYKNHLAANFHVDDREWKIFQREARVEHLAKGTYFVREGKVCQKLGFIMEGVMRYLRHEESGTETTCYFVSENEFAGDPDSFVSRKPSDKNLRTVTDCMLVTICVESWQRLMRDLPRFVEITHAIDHKTSMDLLAQRDFLLNRDAASRYRYFVEHYPHILQRTPLGYVASYLDITPQSLSRLRKQLSGG